MKVIVAFPPNYAEINKAFNISGRQVIFAYGDTIYNPHNITITPALMAHEKVHGARQGNDVEGWWRKYIDDEQFRFDEELPAHVAEYQALVQNSGNNRHARRTALKETAKRLASPLYGRLVTPEAAKRMIAA